MALYPAENFFHPSVCHICKSNSESLKKCGRCRLVYYCSLQHQKEDFEQHKQFCIAVAKALPIVMAQNNCNRNESVMLIEEMCKYKLRRNLTPIEKSIIVFRHKCGFCLTNENLKECSLCRSFNTCDQHAYLFETHKENCAPLKLSLEISIGRYKGVPMSVFNMGCIEFESMDECLTKNSLRNIEKHLLSEFLSRPLTISHILKLVDMRPTGKINIHVIGSSAIDVVSHWPHLLQLYPGVYFQLMFIGPEAPKFQSQGDWMKIVSMPGFYHEENGLDRPDLVVAFNCGLDAFFGTSLDTWSPSLPAILAHRVPVAITAYTEKELNADANRLLNVDPDLRVRCLKNPFASLTPLRDVEGLGVYFINNYLAVVTR